MQKPQKKYRKKFVPKKKVKKEPFNPGKEWAKLTEKEQIKFRELTTRFTQCDMNSLLYMYVNRRDALLLLTACLDDTRAAGEKWLWFATGAVKQCNKTCVEWLQSGKTLYAYLQRLTERRAEKKKDKKLKNLTKRNTNRKTKKPAMKPQKQQKDQL
jgi:hypothetical protein